jgi:transposase-like protein
MLATIHKCKRCGSASLVLNGKNKSGSQTYKCNSCKCFSVLHSVKKTAHIDRDAVEKSFLERNSQRAIARVFGISHSTVANWIKKSPVTGKP